MLEADPRNGYQGVGSQRKMERIFVVVEVVAFWLMMERISMLARVPVVSARRYTSVMCSSTL